MKSREEHYRWEWQPWPSPATNDTASLCGMRDEELWFVGCECLPLLPSSPLPPPRPPLVNGGACGRVFAFYPAQSTESPRRIPTTSAGGQARVAWILGQKCATSTCLPCTEWCERDPALYFPFQSHWTVLYSNPLKCTSLAITEPSY